MLLPDIFTTYIQLIVIGIGEVEEAEVAEEAEVEEEVETEGEAEEEAEREMEVGVEEEDRGRQGELLFYFQKIKQ